MNVFAKQTNNNFHFTDSISKIKNHELNIRDGEVFAFYVFQQDIVIVPYLEGQVGIFMHAKDLRIIYDWKTLNIFLILL